MHTRRLIPLRWHLGTPKTGKVECTVNKDHVKCRCHSFKYDSVCKHSIAVAERVGMLEEHIRHITKSSRKKGQRTTLVEANVNKAVAGKKGSTCRYPYRPQLGLCNGKVLLKGPPSNQQVTCTLRYTTTTTLSC